jgi:hypothetical protein
MDFLDVQAGTFPGEIFELCAKLIYTLSATANNNAGACRVHRDNKVLCATLDLDACNTAGLFVPISDKFSDRLVFYGQGTIAGRFICEPSCLPRVYAT